MEAKADVGRPTLELEGRIDDATVKVASLVDDFHGGVLGIHERRSRP